MNGTQPHGHITILALFGMEILGVDTGPGQTVAGPLNALQQALLDPICSGSGNNACVSAVRADSATTSSGSTNKFSTAHATLGGPAGLDVGAAESNGNISNDPQCQTSSASSSVANVNAAGQAVASLAQSSTTSKACQNQPPSQQTSSSVLGLGGTAVPLPAAGCGNGTPDTQTGIPALLPIVCNGDDSGQAALPNAVREALTVFALAAGSSSVARIGTGSSESVAVAPAAATTPPGNTNGSGNNGNNNNNNNGNNGSGESSKAQCADGIDNDGDGKIDAADPGCHSDGNPNNPASYDRHDNSEQDDNGNNGGTQCADGVDNDGDGKIDARDPGCHTDGNANNPASYNPADNSEGPNAGAGNNNAASSLPFTGSNVLLTLIAGLLLLAAGLSVRRSQAARQR
jgi:hypothetical protein